MFTLPQPVLDFMQLFRAKGFQIYVVGGPVRNLLLGLPIDNWDFTTNATPEHILALYPDAFYHNTYGTVTVPLEIQEENFLFEVTPFRKEAEYHDGRHPSQIEWASTVEEDLARRDFTINAMAFDGETLIDQFHGREHLEQKLIVAVGDPNIRFQEDALRLMRGVRFAAQFGFFIEPNTRAALEKNAELITRISWERIRDELLKILASPHPSEGVLFLRNTHLLHFILPELDVCFEVPQKSPKRHHIYDVGTHLVQALKSCPSTDPITRFATLIHDIGKARTFRKDPNTDLITFYNHEVVGARQAQEIAKRFRLSKEQSDKFVRLVKYHQFTVSELQTDKAIRRFIREVGIEYLDDMMALRTGDRIGSGATPTSWRFELFKKRLEEVQQEPFKVTDLKITGNDVMQITKINPGPQVGILLNKLFEEVEAGILKNEKEALVARLKELHS
ncbi:CCA tRNA nucleotidyltransferase [Candidatus Roizmanbacteria bacterium]|nr:CCA tRNA nucleotidyltransferase [Candidatus Roizmanbacteria bacterium]